MIAQSLKRIQTEGGMANCVVFLADEKKNYYIQFASAKGEKGLRAEAVSNAFLSPKNRLDDVKSAILLDRGWSLQPGSNYVKDFTAADDGARSAITAEVEAVFRDVYGVDPSAGLKEELILQ